MTLRRWSLRQQPQLGPRTLSKCPVFPTNAVFCSTFMWSRKVELEGVSGHEHEQHEASDGKIQLTAFTLRWDAVLQSSPSGITMSQSH